MYLLTKKCLNCKFANIFHAALDSAKTDLYRIIVRHSLSKRNDGCKCKRRIVFITFQVSQTS